MKRRRAQIGRSDQISAHRAERCFHRAIDIRKKTRKDISRMKIFGDFGHCVSFARNCTIAENSEYSSKLTARREILPGQKIARSSDGGRLKPQMFDAKARNGAIELFDIGQIEPNDGLHEELANAIERRPNIENMPCRMRLGRNIDDKIAKPLFLPMLQRAGFEKNLQNIVCRPNVAKAVISAIDEILSVFWRKQPHAAEHIAQGTVSSIGGIDHAGIMRIDHETSQVSETKPPRPQAGRRPGRAYARRAQPENIARPKARIAPRRNRATRRGIAPGAIAAAARAYRLRR